VILLFVVVIDCEGGTGRAFPYFVLTTKLPWAEGFDHESDMSTVRRGGVGFGGR
jgi:hypothetical protein